LRIGDIPRDRPPISAIPLTAQLNVLHDGEKARLAPIILRLLNAMSFKVQRDVARGDIRQELSRTASRRSCR
jgi:hypothetical protein